MKKFGFYVANNSTRLIKYLETYKNYTNCNVIIHTGIENQRLLDIVRTNKLNYFHIETINNLELSNKILTLLSEHEIEYMFCFGDRILKGDLLIKYHNKIINFHPSLLPAFKGLNAIDQALNNSCLLLGNTAHFINDKVDDGLIIMQSILPKSNYTCYDDVLDMQLPMLKQIIQWLEQERISIINNKINVNNSKYKLANYLPNLEDEIS